MTGVKTGRPHRDKSDAPTAERLAAVADRGQPFRTSRRRSAQTRKSRLKGTRKVAPNGQACSSKLEVAPPTRPPSRMTRSISSCRRHGGLLAGLSADDRAATMIESRRILRPGGRLMVIGAVPKGIRAVSSRAAPAVPDRSDAASRLRSISFVRPHARRSATVSCLSKRSNPRELRNASNSPPTSR